MESHFSSTPGSREKRCRGEGASAGFLHGASNFRDLGGHSTDLGRRVRRERVFRSNALLELTSEDVMRLRSLGPAVTIVDLREQAEVDLDGVPPCDDVIRYRHVPFGDSDTALQTGGLVGTYLHFLKNSAESAMKVLNLLADSSHPVVIQCTAGKDRTGILSAILLSCLGVPPSGVVADYSAQPQPFENLKGFLRRRPSCGHLIDTMEPELLSNHPRTMWTFLDAAEREFGGLRRYVASNGGESLIEALENVLLE